MTEATTKTTKTGNYLGLDKGAHKKIFFDRSMMAPTLPQGHPEYSAQPFAHGIVTAYYRAGLAQSALRPKLTELELWTVELDGVFHFRLDVVIAAVTAHVPQPEAAPVVQPLEGELMQFEKP